MGSNSFFKGGIVFFSPVVFFYLSLWVIFFRALDDISIDVFFSILNSNLLFSVLVSMMSAFISLFVGAYLAYIYPTNNLFLRKVFRLTVFAPHLAFAYLIYLFFSPTGLLSRTLYPFLENVILINDFFGIGILLHYVVKEIPFVFLFLLSTNSKKESDLFNVSSDLGASKLETFCKIYLPLKKKSLKVLLVLMFSYALSSYEAPFLLGHYSREFTSVEIMNNFNSLSEQSNSNAQIQALLLLFINVIFAFFLLRSNKK